MIPSKKSSRWRAHRSVFQRLSVFRESEKKGQGKISQQPASLPQQQNQEKQENLFPQDPKFQNHLQYKQPSYPPPPPPQPLHYANHQPGEPGDTLESSERSESVRSHPTFNKGGVTAADSVSGSVTSASSNSSSSTVISAPCRSRSSSTKSTMCESARSSRKNSDSRSTMVNRQHQQDPKGNNIAITEIEKLPLDHPRRKFVENPTVAIVPLSDPLSPTSDSVSSVSTAASSPGMTSPTTPITLLSTTHTNSSSIHYISYPEAQQPFNLVISPAIANEIVADQLPPLASVLPAVPTAIAPVVDTKPTSTRRLSYASPSRTDASSTRSISTPSTPTSFSFGSHRRRRSIPNMLRRFQKGPSSPTPPVPDRAPAVAAAAAAEPHHLHPQHRESISLFSTPSNHKRESVVAPAVPSVPAPEAAPNRLQSRRLSRMPTALSGRSTSSAFLPNSKSTEIPRNASTPARLNEAAGNSVGGMAGIAEHQGEHQPKKLTRSWLHGRNKHSSKNQTPEIDAWVMGPDGGQSEYNTNCLLKGDKVPELWNERAEITVYLYPKASGLGASFRVPEYAISASRIFNSLVSAELALVSRARERRRLTRTAFYTAAPPADFSHRRHSMVAPSLPPEPTTSPMEQDEVRLYLPLVPEDDQAASAGQTPTISLARLVAARNLFAFLLGQPLVAIKSACTPFAVFSEIGTLLKEFNFANLDGSTFGDAAELNFNYYLDQLNLADVRHSVERTLEAVVLGERMRSWALYNEGFCHAVGKYATIRAAGPKTPTARLYDLVSGNTRVRLERAHLDLVTRQQNVNGRLEAFEIPSLFAGIANSTSHEEYRHIHFKDWRAAYLRMRTFALSYYKGTFGHWPPRAKTKKNPMSEGGLNREVLRMLYTDMCSLYDLLVDREHVTSRVSAAAAESEGEDTTTDNKELSVARGHDHSPHISALRKILGEFDNSSPPVLPPIPYDAPRLPTMTSIHENFHSLPAAKRTKLEKRMQPHEQQIMLVKARNMDADAVVTPFLSAFKEFELREARGCRTVRDMVDQRIGYWLLLYVMLQSLPMLVVDAPDLRNTGGCEYFLCEPPQGNFPWVEDAGPVRKMWYGISGGQGGIVELSADVVMYSVEATYQRSHCWLAAKKWEAAALPPPDPADAADAHHHHAYPDPAGPDSAMPYPPHPYHHHHHPTTSASSLPLEPPQHNFHPGDGGGPTPDRRFTPPPTSAAVSTPSTSRPSSPALHVMRGTPSGGARANPALRSSVILGLEPLPPPSGLSPGDRPGSVILGGASRPGSSHRSSSVPPHVLLRDSPPPPMPLSALGVRRGSKQYFATEAMAPPGQANLPPPQGGSTFDDILKSMGQEEKKPSKKKFPFS